MLGPAAAGDAAVLVVAAGEDVALATCAQLMEQCCSRPPWQSSWYLQQRSQQAGPMHDKQP